MKNKIILIIAFCILTPIFALAQHGGIKGTVVSRVDRKPIANATVSLTWNKEYKVQTTNNGEFSFNNIPVGTYALRIEAKDFFTLNTSITVENFNKDLSFITLVSEHIIERPSESSFMEFDMESSDDYQSLPAVLSASRDVFDNIAGYKFGEIRFRTRGYDNGSNSVYLNGIHFNDAISGFSPWSLWAGLNEATRNQIVNSGLTPSENGVAGVNGNVNINATASNIRKGYRFSIVNASGMYQHRVMATYASGQQDNGLSYAVSVSTRQGGNNWVKGTDYNSIAYFASVEKQFANFHKIALTAFASPTERGVQAASTQEVYDMLDNNYYNPNWGYQNGKIRNSRVRSTHEPVIVLNYAYTPNNKVEINSALSYRFGKNGYSALDWYDAPDPRPDYYRNLPSYYADEPYKAEYIKEGWLTDWNIRQINWDKIYDINKNSPRAQYVLEERHINQNDINAKVNASININNYNKLTFGADYRWNVSDHFKKLKDLLGGEYWIDIDKFAEREFGNNDDIQNDLNNPNRIIKEGDKYGYNYKAHIRNSKLWMIHKYSKGRVEAYGALEGGYTKFWREGLYKKGLFPNNSFGNSEKVDFWTYTAKGGITYKIDGTHTVWANIAYLTNAPYFRESFVSPRTRNSLVPNLKTEKIFSSDLNYSIRTPFLRARASAYYTVTKDRAKLFSFFDDINRAFTNFSVTGIDQLNTGVEIGLSAPIYQGLSINSAINYGYYKYTSNPYVTQTIDNNEQVLLDNERVYWKDYKVSGTPQTVVNVGLSYRSSNYLFAGIDINYYDAMYLEANPLNRTDFAHVGLNNSQSQILAQQERFDNAFTLSANIGKSWYINRKYNLGFSFEVKNILNSQDIKTGGYEQMRLKRVTDSSGNLLHYQRFDSKYFYMFGTTYYLNIYLRF